MPDLPLWSHISCVIVCTFGGQRSASEAIPQESFILGFCLIGFPYFEAGFLPEVWGLLIRPGWLASAPHRSSCLHLPRAGITCVHHHTQLFTWVLGPNSGLYVIILHLAISQPHAIPYIPVSLNPLKCFNTRELFIL